MLILKIIINVAFRKRRWIREGKIKPIVDVDNKDDNWTSSSDDEFQGILFNYKTFKKYQ